MTPDILVAMDDSEVAKKALEYALEHHPEGEITVLHVVGTPSGMMGKAVGLALSNDLENETEKQAEVVLDRANAVADEHGTTIATKVRYGHPARAIVDEAAGFDAVILGSHGGSIADRLFVGNVAETVFRRAPVPVTVVR